jgi:hypothetical protein
MDTELLKKNLTMGKRLDELARITGIGALFCLPRAADDDNRSDVIAGTSGKPLANKFDRMDQLGELVPEFAVWLQQKGVGDRAHNARAIGKSIRSLIRQSMEQVSAPRMQGFQTATDFDFMLPH